LNEDRSQPALCPEGLDAKLEFVHVILGKILSLMSKNLVEFYCKEEIRVICDFLYPRKRNMNSGGPVKSAVYLNDIDILSQEDEGMEILGLFFGINDPFPVFVTPASCTDKIACHFDFILNEYCKIANKKQARQARQRSAGKTSLTQNSKLKTG